LAEALPLLPASAAPAMWAVAETFLAVTTGCCAHLIRLIEVLLGAGTAPTGGSIKGSGGGGSGGDDDWQQKLALQLLAADGTIAALFKARSILQLCCASTHSAIMAGAVAPNQPHFCNAPDQTHFTSAPQEPAAQQRCHAVLYSAATQRFLDHDFSAAAGLFAASFQYAPPSARGAAARAMAACHLHKGQAQRACEYLVVAERAEEQPLALVYLLRLKATLDLGDAAAAVRGVLRLLDAPARAAPVQGVLHTLLPLPIASQRRRVLWVCFAAAVHGLEKCADFHASHIQCACALGEAARLAEPLQEALALAVRALIPAGGGRPGGEAGADAQLLLALATALLECAAQDARGSPLPVCDELVTALRTATRQVRALGAQRFAGSAERLQHLVVAGHIACGRALSARALEQCVALATSTCVLADEYETLAGPGDATAAAFMPGVKMAVLVAAVEALAGIAGADNAGRATVSR
jgi:hypothetical protein